MLNCPSISFSLNQPLNRRTEASEFTCPKNTSRVKTKYTGHTDFAFSLLRLCLRDVTRKYEGGKKYIPLRIVSILDVQKCRLCISGVSGVN